jgi:putative nucleotidyltransferase with HDIG domain
MEGSLGSPSSSKRPGRLGLLETRVARRMLGLFLLCALLPTALLALIGYRHVSRQLEDQGRERLMQASKMTGMAMIERLQLVEAELRATTLVASNGPGVRVLDSRQIPGLDSAQAGHLATGRSLIVPTDGPDGTRILMAVPRVPVGPEPAVLWAEIDPTTLRGIADEETGSVLCVFAVGGPVLSCPGQPHDVLAAGVVPLSSSGHIDWSTGKDRFFAGYWTAFLGFQWGTGAWMVVLSEPRSRLLSPVNQFARTFGVIILVALVLVFLVSNIQIRRRMEPLARLQEATVQIAAGDFTSPVRVASGDEFELLAGSFNSMSHQLGRQFNALNAINDISRAALSELKTDKMVGTILARFGSTVPTAAVTLMLRSHEPHVWSAATQRQGERVNAEVRLDPEVTEALERCTGHLWFPAGAHRAPRTELLARLPPDAPVLLLPLRDREELIGIIALAFPAGTGTPSDDIGASRQLADQVTVALGNIRLMERLEQLSWGTLSALARTIDANSPWTAGHSERVTLLSLAIGKELRLSARQLDAIHRGGLLHDIGKISVPAAVLDKPAALTPEEMAVIQTHPAVGARILAPLTVFRDILPIVRHHHERFDGSGYPDGLSGEAIPLLARVVAVADVYDALVSDRPYRSGWTRADAVALIYRTTSSHHDPVVVEAFRALVDRGALDQFSTLPAMEQAYELDLIPTIGVTS